MKNINIYLSDKYKNKAYKKIEDGIYKHRLNYVISLSFTQEPEFFEGENPKDISCYPLKDIADEFSCFISDFYDELNKKSTEFCYVEFSSMKLKNIKKIQSIIGKHVYNIEKNNEIEFIIE